MVRLLGVPAIAAVLLVIGVSVAEAGYCGAARYRCSRRACCRPADCSCCQQCYTVMKTCKKVVYEPHEVTAYKTVFEEVVDKRVIETVKYVPQTAHRYVPTTVMQPPAVPCCEAEKGCASSDCCEPAKCEEMVPVKCLQKMPHTVFKPVPTTETKEVPRVVVKRVPYTVTCYKRKVVCVQVPVEVCCPVFFDTVPCCGRAKSCASAGRGE